MEPGVRGRCSLGTQRGRSLRGGFPYPRPECRMGPIRRSVRVRTGSIHFNGRVTGSMRALATNQVRDKLPAAWASWLGVVAVVLGVLLAAGHGTEWTKQAVIAGATPAGGRLPPAECPEDELIEEGLSVAECEQLVSDVRSFIASAPEWFPPAMTAVAAAGTALAIVSVLIGAALLDRRRWAPGAAIAVFGALAAVDAAEFVVTVNAGPILRGEYLWPSLVWLTAHLMMTIGAAAGRTVPAAASGEAAKAPIEQGGYSRTAVLVHWVLAVSVFFLFASSWWMLALPLPSDEFRYREFPFQLHKNIGITLVVLLGLLLYVRLRHRPAPADASAMNPWMRRLSMADHIVLYALILAVCVSGYLSSSYSGWGTTLWWVVDLPSWGYENEELNILYSDIHLWTCWALLAVVAVHVSGAVYHAFRNDGVVRRMLRL